MIEIRPFESSNAKAISALVRQVFDEHVAPSFEPEGIAEMHRHTAPEPITERAETHQTLVAWAGDQIVGVIELRDAEHVSMFFVHTSHMGQGIGSALLTRVEAMARAAGQPRMTVNSSLNAQTFYECAGFRPVEGPQRSHGFAFIAMEKQL